MNAQPSSPGIKERDIFLAALEQPTPEARASYVERACAGDSALRAAVEALLRNDKEDDFLRTPAIETPQPKSEGTADSTVRLAEGTEKLGDRIGRYKLLQEIGEGGCGVVYMADQEEPVRRRVALKVIKPGMDTRSVIARFEAERQALAMMDHPNIAKVLDAGTIESSAAGSKSDLATGRPYFVMELVRGIRITDYCDQNHLSTRERLDLFIKVCLAIEHAHQKGIIHRDIKPSNILVTLHDGVPVPKVIDFGIAKATEQRLTDKTVFTRFEAFIGTPAYMSPEQAEMSGLDIDTRTDIYSLGVLLYEMLTGKTPFDGKQLLASGLDAMRRTIREEEPLRPSTRLRNMEGEEITTTAKHRRSEPSKLAGVVRGDLDWIVMKALEKDRTRRYETSSAMAHDIQRYLNNEPVTARPPSRIYRFQKFVRRNKLPVAAAAAFAAALLIGLGLSFWQYQEKTRAYERIVGAEREQRRLREAAQTAHATEAQLRHQAEIQERAARQKAYAADINLAQQALAANNLGRAVQMLDRHRPSSGVSDATDLRGWEWRYLWQLCQSEALFTLCRQSNEVHALSVSPDGKWLAVGEAGRDGLSVWDLRARQEIARLPAGEGRAAMAFSTTSSLLAFTSSDGRGPRGGPGPQRVRFWDAVTRRFVGEVEVPGFIRGMVFASDGRLLTATADNAFTVWSVPEGQRLAGHAPTETPSRSRGPIRFGGAFAATRDLSLAAIATPGGTNQVLDTLRLVEVETGKELWSVHAAEENVMAIAFSPNGKVLATGAGLVESSVRLWDVATGVEIARLEGHRGFVSSLLFWPDGRILASASGDQTINLWEVASLSLSGARIAENRTKPAASGTDVLAEVPSLRPLSTLSGHKLEVWSLALMPDNTTLVSGSKDGSVYVWDTSVLQRERRYITLPSALRAWQFAPDSRTIVGIDSQGRVGRWRGGDFQDVQYLFEVGTNLFSATFSGDSRFLAIPSPRGGVRVWDVEKGAIIREIAPDRGRAFVAAFLPRSDHLLTRHVPDDSYHEWNLSDGSEIRSWRGAKESGFRSSGAISPDEEMFLVFDGEGVGRLRNLAADQETPLNLNLKQVSQIAFSPDGQLFAAVSILGSGGLWDSETGEPMAALHGFLQGMHSVTFSPDGRRLAIGSNGKEAVKLWDVASHQELLTLEGRGSIFHTIAFSPDGNILGASNSQGTLHLWRAPSLEEIARLEAEPR